MKNQVPRLLSALALTLFCASLARADDPRLQAVAANWDDTKKQSTDWPLVAFTDENNAPRELYMRVSDVNQVGKKWEPLQGVFSHKDLTDSVPLFALKEVPAPGGDGGAVHYYQASLSPYTASITIKSNYQTYSSMPPMYVYDALVSRPGTSLAIAATVNKDRREKPQQKWQMGALVQMVVLKPTDADAPPWSAFTALAGWPDTTRTDDYTFHSDNDNWQYRGDPSYMAIAQTLLPEEIVVSRVAGLPAGNRDSDEIKKAWEQTAKQNNKAAPYLFASAQRPAIRNAADHARQESAAASDDAFTAFEYKYLALRAVDADPRNGRRRLTDGVKDKQALARWRQFVQKELEFYLKESESLPGAKATPQPWTVKIDFDKELAEHRRRMELMLQGKSVADVYAQPKTDAVAAKPNNQPAPVKAPATAPVAGTKKIVRQPKVDPFSDELQ